MFRYVLVILVVNMCGRSFGLPLGQHTGNGTIMIGNLLSELGKGCKNEFVASLIKSKLDECNLEMPPIHNSQIRCLMFYDASVVLCNFTTNSPKLATDFAVNTKAKQDLSMFCAEAAHLSLPPTRFRTNITEVLHKVAPCTVVCTDDDIMSGGTSFYCKYYKWMIGIVHTQIAPVANNLRGNQVSIDGQNKINDTVVTNVASASDALVKKEEINESSSDTNNKITSTNTVDANQMHVAAQAEPSSPPFPDQKKASNISETALENTVDETQDNSDKKGANSGVQIEHVLQENSIGHGIEAPKLNSGLDREEDDQGMDDTDDQGDPDAGEGMEDTDLGNKPDLSDKKSAKQEEPPLVINSESSHGDTYLNPIEGYTDDDDHFFPFFLTAVIVVIVLYVLYHNKNKVGKMFFGLIVEGRQSGRRRTSRGHAYRRLDTLEQAMSANTAAPPSKIIY